MSVFFWCILLHAIITSLILIRILVFIHILARLVLPLLQSGWMLVVAFGAMTFRGPYTQDSTSFS